MFVPEVSDALTGELTLMLALLDWSGEFSFAFFKVSCLLLMIDDAFLGMLQSLQSCFFWF